MPIESEADTASPHQRGIDAAFRPAIEAGALTPVEAAQRGNREALAQKLVARHGIRIEDAYDVADNRASLARLIRQHAADRPREAGSRTRRSSTGWPKLVAAIVLVLILGAVVARNVDRPEPASAGRSAVRPPPRSSAAMFVDRSRPTPAPKIEVQLDAGGYPTLIRATRPEAVLLSYCDRRGRQPVGLAQGLVPDASLWLGVHYDARDAGTTRAIAIRKESDSGHWIAGDGSSPIPAFTVTQRQLGAIHRLAPSKP